MEDLPTNTVIVDSEAFDINYLNASPEAQLSLIEWYNGGNEFFIKLNDDVIVDPDGEPISLDNLPEMVIYFDANGNYYFYEK